MTREPRDPGGDGSLSVATVARLVGVAPSTLRTWARRYGLEPTAHRSGLHRRYSQADLARLRLMRSLASSGLSSREAAERALAAGDDQLVAVAQAPGVPVDRLALPDRPAGSAGALGAPGALGVPGSLGAPVRVDGAVRALLTTAARRDARGTTALLRTSLRDLGAARTFDERLVAVRAASRGMPGPVRERVEETVAASVPAAVGAVATRRAPRNPVPVTVASVPWDDDPVARLMCRAALAERSVASRDGGAAHPVDDLVHRAAEAGGVLVLVAGGRSEVPARAAGGVVHWVPGRVCGQGLPGTLAQVVAVVEPRCVVDD